MRSTPALALAMAGTTLAAAAAAKPNVLFVLGDQWRGSAFGFAGDPNVKTPHLDQLAAESVRFLNAVSVCPVCTPYRASLLTGRYPTTTGMFLNDLYLPASELCMAEIFKSAGYDTAYIGKWHLDGHGRDSYIPPDRRQGFDYWKAAECDHEYNRSHYYEAGSPEKKQWAGYDAFAQTVDAQAYLRQHRGSNKPFMLFLAFGPPHAPHASAPAKYQQLYPPQDLKLPPNVPPERAAAARNELRGYYAHCSALDQCVGDLLETLRETGLAKDTVVVFTSDHGEMMGAHNIPPVVKQWPYDEAAVVPFLLRDPRAGARVLRTPLGTPDILPTLLGLAGIPAPETMEGEDLAPVVSGRQPERDRAALVMSVSPFASNMGEYRAIRTMHQTYVRRLDGPWLMFDNENDPGQLQNLVGKPEHQALQRELDGRLSRELARIGDEFRPRQFYLEKWGYQIARHGSIDYGPGAKVQGPGLSR